MEREGTGPASRRPPQESPDPLAPHIHTADVSFLSCPTGSCSIPPRPSYRCPPETHQKPCLLPASPFWPDLTQRSFPFASRHGLSQGGGQTQPCHGLTVPGAKCRSRWRGAARCGAGRGAAVLNPGWGPPCQGGQRGWPRAGSPLSSGPHQLEVPPRPPAVTSTPAPKAEPTIIPATRNEPIGLKPSDFLPVSGGPA